MRVVRCWRAEQRRKWLVDADCKAAAGEDVAVGQEGATEAVAADFVEDGCRFFAGAQNDRIISDADGKMLALRMTES